ncbi:hypothetical protein HAX54_001187, partial [Datura stramonium]|nr:hypothetical protein [Datura stramonium]
CIFRIIVVAFMFALVAAGDIMYVNIDNMKPYINDLENHKRDCKKGCRHLDGERMS